MTDKELRSQKSPMSAGQKLFCVMSVIALALTFVYSDAAISAMSEGMRLCVSTLIPSLFPVMVLSELLVRSGAAELLGKLFGAPISRLFGISREGSVAWILGTLCGFPIGMKCALSLYERGKISRAELEHLSTFCNMPSSAFLIGAVGASLFGSKDFGIILYVSHAASCVIVGFAGKFYFSGKKKEYFWGDGSLCESRKGCAASFVGSVTSSAMGMLFICAFVLFFSSVTGILRVLIEEISLSEQVSALIFGFFEMTGGVVAASELELGAAIPVVAAVTGWSGLSVHFQLIGICGSHKPSFRPYFLAKIASALICAALTCGAVAVFDGRLSFFVNSDVQSLLVVGYEPRSIAVLAFFFLSCLKLMSKRRK